MIALGLGITWFGYSYVIYGWTLLKGWDIRWKDLANPIHPYQWPPPGQPIPTVPQGQILPTGGASTKPGTSAARPPVQ